MFTAVYRKLSAMRLNLEHLYLAEARQAARP
jgi:hypothetical protein